MIGNEISKADGYAGYAYILVLAAGILIVAAQGRLDKAKDALDEERNRHVNELAEAELERDDALRELAKLRADKPSATPRRRAAAAAAK